MVAMKTANDARSQTPLVKRMECLALMSRTYRTAWSDAFRDAGIPLTLTPASSLEDAAQKADSRTLSFALTYIERANDTFHPSFALATVCELPLVVISPKAFDAEDREVLRRRGVDLIVDAMTMVESVRKINEWAGVVGGEVYSRGGRSTLPDIMQFTGTGPGDLVLLTVRLPDTKRLCTARWENMRLATADREGWLGRVYLRGGVVEHAEAPGLVGVPALAEMFTVARPVIWIQAATLEPSDGESLGPVQGVIINAAHAMDEYNRRGRFATMPPMIRPLFMEDSLRLLESVEMLGPISTPPVPPGRFQPEEMPPLPTPKETAMTTPARILQSASGLTGIAQSDAGGNVLDFAGEFDAELACAVGVMCHQQIVELSELIGASEVRGWGINVGRVGLYTIVRGSEMLIGQGPPSKAIAGQLKKIRNASN